MTQRKQLGIAVIGSGRIGSMRARQALEHPAVNFVAVSDLDGGNARTLAEKVGAHVHSANNLEIIARSDVDAVIVSTSEGEHLEPVLQAIELGKPVLVEKPIALSVANADRIIAAAEKKGVEVRVGYSRRYKDLRYLLAKEQILQGRLGTMTGAPPRRSPCRDVPAESAPWRADSAGPCSAGCNPRALPRLSFQRRR